MSASEIGALRAGFNGVVSPTQVKREMDRANEAMAGEIVDRFERAKARIASLETKCERLERENAQLRLDARGRG